MNSREIFREQEIADVQMIVKRACKTGADQTIELPILKKLRHPIPADLFSDAGMDNLNCATRKGLASSDHFGIINLAPNHPDTVAVGRGFFVEPAQKSCAFRRQGERNRNHRLI